MDQRLEQINAKWKELMEQASRLSQAGAQQRELERQHAERKARVSETGAIYRKEQDDVDKLEKGGLRSFLLSLTGDKEERLTKERREAMAAKCQYDQAVSDLEYLENRLRELRGQQATLKHVRQRLEELSREKAALLKELGGETGARLMELDQRQAELEHQLREVGEALSAGRRAEVCLSQVLDSLDSARDWGVWDMVGGGLLSTAMKHERLDDAQDGLRQVQRALSDFRTQLADVGDIRVPDISIGSFATFADYFFDAFLADLAVMNRIRNAQQQVRETKQQIEQVLLRLKQMIEEVNTAYGAEKARRDQFLCETAPSALQ